MLTLTRQGLLLSLSATVIPSQGSSDVPVAVVNDINTYVGYTLEPRVGYYLNGIYKSIVCVYDVDANTFDIPAEAFKQNGVIDVTLALIDSTNANHIETCQTTHATVNKAPLGTVVLPDQTTWQDYVNSYMNQLFDSNYKPQFDQIQQDLENLAEEAQQQQQTAEQQQTQIDNAISVMGEYQIVSNDPVQIQFKQGDGTFGPTVDLGDGLASKSMVNAGYYQSIGSQYSGSASDYGIQVEEIVGAYTQETTTGAQLWQNPAETTSKGVTLTHLEDGWINLNGTCTESANISLLNNHVDSGTYTISFEKQGSLPDNANVIAQVYSATGGAIAIANNAVKDYSGQLNEADDYQFRIRIDGGFNYENVKVRVMFQKGNTATAYEPYTGGEPSPNPNYPQKPQFVQIENFYTIGQNLLNADEYYGNYKNGDVYTATNTEFNSVRIPIPNELIGKTLLFSADLLSNADITQIYVRADVDGKAIAGNGVTNTTNYVNSYVIFTPETENDFVKITYGSGRGTVSAKNIMLAISDVQIPYTPYTGIDTVTLSEPLILRALPNGVCDTYEDGVITRRVGVVEFDGSSDERWNLYNVNKIFAISLPLLKPSPTDNHVGNLICDKFVNIPYINAYNGLQQGIGTHRTPVIGIHIDEDSVNTLESWKTWLQSNPITVWYVLAEPTTEQLVIPTLTSFYPFTNAWCDSVVQPHITWNVLTGRSAILDGLGNLIQEGYMTPQDNFFDNADYRQGAINQRGETSYTTSGAKTYTIDGWYIENSGSNLGVGTSFISVVGTFGRRINIVKENETYLAFTIQINLEKAQTIVIDTTTLNEGQDYTYQVDDNITFGIFFFSGQNYAWTYITCINNANIDFMKLERGHKFTGMPVWNYALEYLKCCRLLYVWYLPEIPSHGYNSINNLSYFTGTAFPVPFSSAPTWTVKQLLMDQVDVSSDLNTINVTPNRCTSISLTGQISTISGTIIFSNEPS